MNLIPCFLGIITFGILAAAATAAKGFYDRAAILTLAAMALVSSIGFMMKHVLEEYLK